MRRKTMRRWVVAGLVVLMSVFAATALVQAAEYKTKDDLLAEAKAEIEEITVEQAFNDYFEPQARDVVFLDVREADEVEAGHVPQASWIARGFLEFKIEGMFPDRDAQTLIVYCKSGGRSSLATRTLQVMGYDAINMDGGFAGWQEKRYPVRRGAISEGGGGCG